MDAIRQMLRERKQYLEEVKKRLIVALEIAPEGTMRLNTSNGCTQYFYRKESSDRAGVYIPKEQFSLAKALAQKDYNKRILHNIEKEIKAIDKHLSMLPDMTIEEIYKNLHIERQKIITPIRETDEQYKQKWEAVEYKPKEIDDMVPVIKTERGELVRSKSELIIADLLYREGIPYRYECPLLLKGHRLIHPDFTTLNVRKRKVLYWEHLGMMDDAEYASKAVNRLNELEENGIVNGINLIVTMETKNHPLSPHLVRKRIDLFLKG